MSKFTIIVRDGGIYETKYYKLNPAEDTTIHVTSIWHSSDHSYINAISMTEREIVQSFGNQTIYRIKAFNFPFESFGVSRSNYSSRSIFWVEVWEED